MKFQVLTIFPQMIETLRSDGVVGQACEAGLISIATANPRDFTADKHRTVDDRPFGGGDGMLMMAEPLAQCLESFPNQGHRIFVSPKGRLLTDARVQELVKLPVLTIVCGRYAGVDQRFLSKYIDEEISIGDYVLSGGEIAACALIDAVSRFVPGVLGHQDSALKDSLTQGWLEAPAYTRPRVWDGHSVPEVLTGGHHEQIEDWKLFVGGLLTWQKRPEILRLPPLSKRQKTRWLEFAESLTEKELKEYDLNPFELGEFRRFLENL